ncbi:MAG: hypothetical protein O2971_14615 [Proteobacteria bacterium]|nr:hypothetical protein [Pseudomonadota bacterium]
MRTTYNFRKYSFIAAFLLAFAFATSVAIAQLENRIQKLGDIEFRAISELSGLARSRRYDDVLWMHNDSGDQPRLFAVDGNGRVIIPAFLSNLYHGEQTESGKQPWPGLIIETAVNIDWEDIAVDEDFIYIADMGNNGNARRDLGVYIVAEPNPRARQHARPFKFVPVRYPEQSAFPPEPPARWHFDSEAVFVFNGSLYFLTKHRGMAINELAGGTNLYRLDSMDSEEMNVLTPVDALADAFFLTAAELSPDSMQLAAVGYTELWLFTDPMDSDGWLSGYTRRLPLDINFTGLIESLTWLDDETLLIGNEDEELFTVDVTDLPLHDGVSRVDEGLREFREYMLRRR